MAATLTDIRLLVAAFEEGSFTAAARRENATQSGVSQHISRLEERLGVALFERAKGRIRPTAAGKAYYARCIDVLRSYAAAGASVAVLAGRLTGEIRVGLMPTMTRSALSPALARFAEEHPEVAITILEAYSGALTRDVLAGRLDFAVVPAFAGGTGLVVRPFLTTPETLVSRSSGGPVRHLAHLAPVRLADIGPLRMVLPGPENTRRRTLDTYFAAHGIEIVRTVALDAMMGTLDHVGSSDWVTVLPGVMMARDVNGGRFKVNPIAAPPLDLDLVVIEPARRIMSPAAAAFFAVLGAETRRVNEVWEGAGRVARTGRTRKAAAGRKG